MMPKDVEKEILTIAVRTQKNLEYIYKSKCEGADVEEFTQLLNSMLGMVISLREDYFKGECVSWEDVEKEIPEELNGQINLDALKEITGKPSNQKSPNLEPSSTSFSRLITKLRHAFAHRNFNLIPNESGEKISGVTVWNNCQIKRTEVENLPDRIWEADILEEQLKDLAYLIVAYVLHTSTIPEKCDAGFPFSAESPERIQRQEFPPNEKGR